MKTSVSNKIERNMCFERSVKHTKKPINPIKKVINSKFPEKNTQKKQVVKKSHVFLASDN